MNGAVKILNSGIYRDKAERVQYIDIAKGLGVFLMLVGHQPNYIPSGVGNWIYSFHMPLFFLIAGFFHDDQGTFFNAIIKYIKKLIVPYFVICFLMMVLNIMSTGRVDFFAYYIKETLKGEGATHIEWFLVCLFWSNILADFVIKRIKKLELQYLVIVIMVYAGYFCSIVNEKNVIWKIDSAFFSVGFVFLGYRLYKRRLCFKAFLSPIIIPLLLFISVLGCIGELVTNTTDVALILDINSNKYISVISNYVLAIIGSIFILALSKKIAVSKNGWGGKVIRNILTFVGYHSMVFFPIVGNVVVVIMSHIKSDNAFMLIIAHVIVMAGITALIKLHTYIKLNMLENKQVR